MSTGRMRRVDEAIRQVIGDAVAGELKDPRVGFVTVTDVRTSADLSHARVYVSVLGDERRAARRRCEGLRSAHGYLQRPGRRRAAAEAHADAGVLLRRHDRPRAARRRADRRESGTTGDATSDADAHEHGALAAREQVLERIRAATRASCSRPTRTPTATRSARWSRCRGC